MDADKRNEREEVRNAAKSSSSWMLFWAALALACVLGRLANDGTFGQLSLFCGGYATAQAINYFQALGIFEGHLKKLDNK